MYVYIIFLYLWQQVSWTLFSLCVCVSCTTNEQTIKRNLKVHKVVPILPLPNYRVMRLYAIYSILHISFCNIFIEKEKYNKQQLCVAITKFF